MRLPAVPETVKVVTVVVIAAVKRIECATVPSSLKSLKVFDPTIVIEPVLVPLENHILLYVLPPPEKVAEAEEVSVYLTVDVFELKVKFVTEAVDHDVPELVTVHVPEPIVNVRTLAFELLKVGVETLKLFASKVP